MGNYRFRGYCDICNSAGPWFPDAERAKLWRSIHFSHKHPDNPMEKTNCRIQRGETDEGTNKTPTCVICGDEIDESAEEVPVYVDDDFGEYDGTAYHMNRCGGEVFETVFSEVEPQTGQSGGEDG